MPRQITSLAINDLSTFTKTLRRALQQQDTLPGHASMLSLVAKAAGFENYQHAKAAKPDTPSLRLDKALRVFDHGIMTRWPQKTSVQFLCLWAFWSALPAKQDLSETQVNNVLKSGHSFGDHVLLRRSLIDHKLVSRTIDGKVYRRIEQAPPVAALALIKAVQRP